MPTATASLPSLELLSGMFEYSVVTGLLYRKKATQKYPVGSAAGSCYRKNGYTYVYVEGRRYLAHRLAWKMVTGGDPKVFVDHIDGDSAHNAWHNLREATNPQNLWNRGKQRDNTTGYKGVAFLRQRGLYRAEIKHENKRTYLGYFEKPEEAHRAYCEAARRFHGEFART